MTMLIGVKTVQRIFRFIFGGFDAFSGANKSRKNEQPKPQTQEDRIIDYQRKSFESSKIEDVDFVEIKEPDKPENID